MSESDYLYHLTTKTLAFKIKSGGLASALNRIGQAVANPHGAFAQNREEMEATKFKQKIMAYLGNVLSRGATERMIKEVKGQYVPFAFTPTGSNHDHQKLTEIETGMLADYARLIHGLGPPNVARASHLRKQWSVECLAEDLRYGDKNHFLARLAVQVVAIGYKIEETITASHVYFLKPLYAVGGYAEYRAHLNAVDLVMLRVLKSQVSTTPDDSDYRAEMTTDTVGPDKIEVMESHDRFTEEAYRCDEKNWKPLYSLA